MGKRSCRTTKNGKYMNPTDQARKEQRRRELKKNKKQRDVVRTAIIKSKEPKRILEELEHLDEAEYNPLMPASLNSRVILEKRRKLKETLDRIREMMDKEAPESVGELRQMITNYEKRRIQRQTYYEQVKNAERVRPDQIPLPSEQPPPPFGSTAPGDIPLPGRNVAPAHGILKKPSTMVTILQDGSNSKTVFRPMKNIPGPPPYPPPDLSDSGDESSSEEDSESDESVNSESPSDSSSAASSSDSENEGKIAETTKPKKSLRFADDLPSDNTKDTRLTVTREKQQIVNQKARANAEEDETPYDPEQPVESEPSRPFFAQPPNVPGSASFVPPSFPPPLPPMMAGRMPPFGAPQFGDMQAPRSVRRLPGGRLVLAGGPAVLQAPPTTFQRVGGTEASESSQQQQLGGQSHQLAPPPADPKVTTIEKKAQLKNLLQESTKFVPPQLKVRREFKDAHGRVVKPAAPARVTSMSMPSSSSSSSQKSAISSYSVGGASSAAVAAAKGADKDDIYAQFMKGLDGLL